MEIFAKQNEQRLNPQPGHPFPFKREDINVKGVGAKVKGFWHI